MSNDDTEDIYYSAQEHDEDASVSSSDGRQSGVSSKQQVTARSPRAPATARTAALSVRDRPTTVTPRARIRGSAPAAELGGPQEDFAPTATEEVARRSSASRAVQKRRGDASNRELAGYKDDDAKPSSTVRSGLKRSRDTDDEDGDETEDDAVEAVSMVQGRRRRRRITIDTGGICLTNAEIRQNRDDEPGLEVSQVRPALWVDGLDPAQQPHAVLDRWFSRNSARTPTGHGRDGLFSSPGSWEPNEQRLVADVASTIAKLGNRAVDLSDQNRKQGCALAEYRRTIREQRKELADKDTTIGMQEKTISMQEKKLADADLTIRKHQKDVADKDKMIRKQQQELADEDSTIREQQKVIADRDKAIREQQKDIAGKDKVIREGQKDIAGKDKVIREAQKDIAAKDKVIREQQKDIAGKDKIIRKQQKDVADKDMTIRELQMSIAKKEKAIIKKQEGRSRKSTADLTKKKNELKSVRDEASRPGGVGRPGLSHSLDPSARVRKQSRAGPVQKVVAVSPPTISATNPRRNAPLSHPIVGTSVDPTPFCKFCPTRGVKVVRERNAIPLIVTSLDGSQHLDLNELLRPNIIVITSKSHDEKGRELNDSGRWSLVGKHIREEVITFLKNGQVRVCSPGVDTCRQLVPNNGFKLSRHTSCPERPTEKNQIASESKRCVRIRLYAGRVAPGHFVISVYVCPHCYEVKLFHWNGKFDPVLQN